MTYTGPGFNDRHQAVFAHKLYQGIRTAGNEHIDIPGGGEQLLYSFALSRQQRYTIFGHTIFLQYLFNDLHGGLIGMIGFLASFQHTTILAAQAERGYIESNIGPAFINGTHHTERYGNFLHLQAI